MPRKQLMATAMTPEAIELVAARFRVLGEPLRLRLLQQLAIGEDTFKRTHKLPADLFGTSMGVFSAPPERVELEFDAAVAPHVRGRVWHDSQQIQELADGRLRMTLDVSNDWALRSWLLGFGARVRVLAPDTLAAAMREELERAVRRYV